MIAFIRETVMPLLRHPIPRGAAGPMGWWYVFGSASITLLLLQILTGIGLAFTYVPSADRAYETLQSLNYDQPWGWFLRALHFWAGSAMTVMVAIHMTQVFLHGAYKYPRGMTWTVGVVLLLLTLGMMFTGQVLRWDADAYWGVGIGASIAGRTPVLGPSLVRLLLGGPVIGGETLSRFFAYHVFVIPGLLLAMLAVHLWLVFKHGISEPPVPGEPVDPATYDAKYKKELDEGEPFLGPALWKDAFFSAFVVIVVVVLAAVVGPRGPGEPPDPTLPAGHPRPDWPFLWLFGLLALSPPEAETFIMFVFPLLLIGGLFLVPIVSRRGERAPSKRPVAALTVVVVWTCLGALTYEGQRSPWSPDMNSWSRDPIPVELVKNGSPRELQGALVFQNKNCRNCHVLGDKGGLRGPDLNAVGARLTRNQLIDQVSNGTPGGGNMPAYGKQIGPEEMDALADFLVSLRPAGVSAARTSGFVP